MRRPQKAPQVSFNMSNGPLPRSSPCGHLSGCSGGHQNKTQPSGENLTANHAHELLSSEDTAWCFQHSDKTIGLLNVLVSLKRTELSLTNSLTFVQIPFFLTL